MPDPMNRDESGLLSLGHSGGPHHSSGYHSDGHKLTIRIDEGFIRAEIECPGEGRCEGLREFGGPGDPRTCIVQYNAGEFGTEFLEWQEKPYDEAATPCEIEWYDWGSAWTYFGTYFEHPEYEFFWRPRQPPSSGEGGDHA